MAEAKVTSHPVTKTVVEQVETVVLTLSKDEAQFIIDLIGSTVVGSSTQSRRKYGNSIFSALNAVDIEFKGIAADSEGHTLIRFKNVLKDTRN